jgi:hypothetical protein
MATKACTGTSHDSPWELAQRADTSVDSLGLHEPGRCSAHPVQGIAFKTCSCMNKNCANWIFVNSNAIHAVPAPRLHVGKEAKEKKSNTPLVTIWKLSASSRTLTRQKGFAVTGRPPAHRLVSWFRHGSSRLHVRVRRSRPDAVAKLSPWPTAVPGEGSQDIVVASVFPHDRLNAFTAWMRLVVPDAIRGKRHNRTVDIVYPSLPLSPRLSAFSHLLLALFSYLLSPLSSPDTPRRHSFDCKADFRSLAFSSSFFAFDYFLSLRDVQQLTSPFISSRPLLSPPLLPSLLILSQFF